MGEARDRLEEDVLKFFGEHMDVWPLYKTLETEILRRYPQARVRVQKTQISFSDRYMFACVSFMRPERKAALPARYFVLTLGLPEPISSQRAVAQTEPYPGRWTVHVPVSREDDLDAELFGWLDLAHDFGRHK